MKASFKTILGILLLALSSCWGGDEPEPIAAGPAKVQGILPGDTLTYSRTAQTDTIVLAAATPEYRSMRLQSVYDSADGKTYVPSGDGSAERIAAPWLTATLSGDTLFLSFTENGLTALRHADVKLFGVNSYAELHVIQSPAP